MFNKGDKVVIKDMVWGWPERIQTDIGVVRARYRGRYIVSFQG